MTNLTKCLFHSHSHGNNGEHIGCVTAMRFGRLWLVDDAQTCYWTDQDSVDLADDAKYQDGDGYSMWCSDTPMLEYGKRCCCFPAARACASLFLPSVRS